TGTAAAGSVADSAAAVSEPATPGAEIVMVALRTDPGIVQATWASPSGSVKCSALVAPVIRPFDVSGSENVTTEPACGFPEASVTWTLTGIGSTLPGGPIWFPPATSE